MKRDSGVYHLLVEYGGRSGPNSWWVQASPRRTTWASVRKNSGPAQGGRVSVPGRSADWPLNRAFVCEVMYQI